MCMCLCMNVYFTCTYVYMCVCVLKDWGDSLVGKVLAGKRLDSQNSNKKPEAVSIYSPSEQGMDGDVTERLWASQYSEQEQGGRQD